MAKKKRSSNIHIKKEVKQLGIFFLILIVLGLIFMNWYFTLALVLGIALILWLSNWFTKKKKKKWIRVVVNCAAIFVLICAIAGVGGVAWFLHYVVVNSPPFNEEALAKSQTTKVYDQNGVEIAKLGAEKREIIKYDQMNEVLIDALIATEDSRFFQHNGFDAPRFLMASIKQILLRDEDAGGASTLTMQVAKNSYNTELSTVSTGFKGIFRKFSDIYLAVFKIEKSYSKQEIIEFYVNNYPLGSNSYGVEQASQTYFGKHASELNLAEASLLVGLFKAPTAYNPFNHPEAAYARREKVLNLMYRHGYISKEERDIANSIPISSLLNTSRTEQKYYSYINTVIDEAIEKYGVDPLSTSMLIYTNMNADYQTILDDVLSGKTYTWENPVVQAGFAVVDNYSGKVLAIGGGRNQDGISRTNFATSTSRQIGSSAKPIFVYAPGMEYNNWSTYTLFDDSPYYYTSGQPIYNSDGEYYGILTLRDAMAHSRNIPALKGFQQLDNKKVLKFAQSLGISLEKESIETNYLHEAYAVGAFNGSNPLEMAAAYAAFANGGYYYEPYTINKIVFRDTGEVITYESEKTRVMSDSTAFMITDTLKSAVAYGVGDVARVPGVNVASKTGTTNYDAATIAKYGLRSAINDCWVIGYDPHITIGFWYGYEPLSTEYQTSVLAAYNQRRWLWSATAAKMFVKDGSDFKVPDSVVRVAVEKGTDVNQPPKLPSEFTPQDKITYEYFKKGTEPTEVSTAYQKLEDATNLKAEYNPSDMSVTLTWDPITKPKDLITGYGNLGYKIYLDGEFVGFTENSTYQISDVYSPSGTYKVVTGYRNSDSWDSEGITDTIQYEDPAVYDARLRVPQNKTYRVGANLDNYDINPSANDVTVTKDGESVSANVTITITNKNGDITDNISSMEEDVFTITYKIKYRTYSVTLKRTVTIEGS